MSLPYNSEVETGLRALIVLEAIHPRACSLTELTWFDYLVVHSSDLNGPESLHPDLPSRGGELLVRRRLIQQSVNLMSRLHLVDELYGSTGVLYRAGEDAPSFLDTLQADYSVRLKSVARWIGDRFRNATSEDVEAQIGVRIGRWTAEFLEAGAPGELHA
jgi:hypothetical protein